MIEPLWITLAKKEIGTIEIVGARHNKSVLQYAIDSKNSWIKTDEVPWCATFVSAILERAAVPSTKSASSLSYASWGRALNKPVFGCIVVFSRKGGGHVGFCVGRDKANNLLILGGNQSNGVNVKAFARSRVTAYRYPIGHQVLRSAETLALGYSEKSTTEA